MYRRKSTNCTITEINNSRQIHKGWGKTLTHTEKDNCTATMQHHRAEVQRQTLKLGTEPTTPQLTHVEADKYHCHINTKCHTGDHTWKEYRYTCPRRNLSGRKRDSGIHNRGSNWLKHPQKLKILDIPGNGYIR